MLKVLLSLIVILTSISIVFVWLKVEAAGPFRKNVDLVEILAEKDPKPSSSRENSYNKKPTEKYIETTEAGLLISYFSKVSQLRPRVGKGTVMPNVLPFAVAILKISAVRYYGTNFRSLR